MKKLLYVTGNELLMLLKDKMALVWMLILPLGLTAIVGFAFGGFNSSTEGVVVNLPVVNDDSGQLGASVVAILAESDNMNVETCYNSMAARELVEDGERVGALFIPPEFSEAMTGGRSTFLKLYVPPGGQTTPLLESMLRAIAGEFSNIDTTVSLAISEVQIATGQKIVDFEGISQRVVAGTVERKNSPQVVAVLETVGNAGGEFDVFGQIVPGYAVMFAMFTVLSASAGILEEKERGTFRRLVVSPVSQFSLLGGKLLGHFIIGVVQVTIMFIFGTLLFGVDLGQSWVEVIIMTLATCWATTGLGILLVSIIGSRRQIHPITTLVILGSSAIGGAWFPLFLMPETVQHMSRVTLVAWAMEGYNCLILLGGSLRDIWLNVAVLVLYGALCFGIGVKHFRFREA